MPNYYDYVVCIPTYGRARSLGKHTLNTLITGMVEKDKIHLYCVEDEVSQYRDLYGDLVAEVHSGPVGLTEQRWHIQNEWPEGKFIWMMDDDVQKFVHKGIQKLHTVANVDAMIAECFEKMWFVNGQIVGLYPVPNNMFMKDTVTTTLRLLVGSAYGMINTHDPYFHLHMGDQKEDHERSILYWERYGSTPRVNFLSAITRYYKEPGGLQLTRTEELVQANVDKLLDRWPGYLAPAKPHKGTNMPEVRFKRIKEASDAEG